MAVFPDDAKIFSNKFNDINKEKSFGFSEFLAFVRQPSESSSEFVRTVTSKNSLLLFKSLIVSDNRKYNITLKSIFQFLDLNQDKILSISEVTR